ncbi:hypothetical protein V1478_013419 [Vespula squamosa]|uniref:Uncharacterized protein n=1 Tax=Vespula squamosa TaxID=30214 RepID=A0ABD2AAS4_VESSQ
MKKHFVNFSISIYRKYYRPRSHRVEVAAFGDPRANADSTLQFAFRDAFPLRVLQASQPTGDGSHREEVAAFGDPRANADSTLQFAFRDAFPLRELQASQPTGDGNDCLFSAENTEDVRSNLFARKYLLPIRFSYKASISDPGPTARRLLHSGTHELTLTLLYNSRSEMPFRFGSFRLLSPLEMGETPLTEGSTVHSVCFRHLETRPVVSIFRYFKDQNGVLENRVKEDEKKKKEKRRSKEEEKKEKETRNVCAGAHERKRIRNDE